VRYLTADSLGYLSREGLLRAVQAVSSPLTGGAPGLCDACFSGNYPIPIAPPATRHRQLPLLQV
jgi:amidophosphoribosyltransferase